MNMAVRIDEAAGIVGRACMRFAVLPFGAGMRSALTGPEASSVWLNNET